MHFDKVENTTRKSKRKQCEIWYNLTVLGNRLKLVTGWGSSVCKLLRMILFSTGITPELRSTFVREEDSGTEICHSVEIKCKKKDPRLKCKFNLFSSILFYSSNCRTHLPLQPFWTFSTQQRQNNRFAIYQMSYWPSPDHQQKHSVLISYLYDVH